MRVKCQISLEGLKSEIKRELKGFISHQNLWYKAIKDYLWLSID